MIHWSAKTLEYYLRSALIEPYGYDIAKNLEPYIRKKQVLDVGCGPGAISFFLAKYASQVLGIDQDPLVIQEARKRSKSMGFINLAFNEMDACSLPPKSCDVLIAISFSGIHLWTKNWFYAAREHIILVRHEKERNHNPDRKLSNGVEFLRKEHIAWDYFSFDTSFGQHFKSLEEAKEFAEEYQIGAENPKEFFWDKLIYQNGEYPWFFPKKKRMGVWIISRKSMDKWLKDKEIFLRGKAL